MSSTARQLRVSLCHASQDKLTGRELYQRLLAEGWIDPSRHKQKFPKLRIADQFKRFPFFRKPKNEGQLTEFS